MAVRRLLPLFVALSLGAAACGSADRPTSVAAGGEPQAATARTGDAVSTTALVSTTVTAPTAAVTSAAAVTSSTAVAQAGPGSTAGTADPGPTAPSPVPGLDAAQLRQAVEAPLGTTTRAAVGPTLDRLALSDGTRVWRVRVPGDFTARSARVAVSVGGRLVGEGVLAGDLQSITAITTDGTGLTAGRAVTYRWEGGAPVAAGTLAVIR